MSIRLSARSVRAVWLLLTNVAVARLQKAPSLTTIIHHNSPPFSTIGGHIGGHLEIDCTNNS